MAEYRDDILDDIARLQRDQAGQFSSAQQRAPLTKASAGWELPNRTVPAAPASGGHIYSIGNEMRWKSASGSDYSLVPVQVPVASAVANAANIVSGDGPATYNQTWGHNMYVGLVDVKDQLNALLTALRNAGLLDT